MHCHSENTSFCPKITHFPFVNSPIIWKITHFLLKNPPFKGKSCIFSSKIPHLPPNHAFSLQKYPIIPRITHFLLRNPLLTPKSRIISWKIPHFTQQSLLLVYFAIVFCIRHCNELAEKYGYEKLQFLEGDIADYEGVNREIGRASCRERV